MESKWSFEINATIAKLGTQPRAWNSRSHQSRCHVKCQKKILKHFKIETIALSRSRTNYLFGIFQCFDSAGDLLASRVTLSLGFSE